MDMHTALQIYTVPLIRKLTGNTFANGYRTDIENRYENMIRQGTERIPNRNGMDKERQNRQNLDVLADLYYSVVCQLCPFTC